MVCEINWVVRDMCRNIKEISITRTDNFTLGADKSSLRFDDMEIRDVGRALQIKGYLIDRKCTEYTDSVQNRDLGRMYLSGDVPYIKVHDGMLFVHGQCIGVADDVDCVYSSEQCHCLYNNGTGTLYRSDAVSAVSYKTGLTGKVFNYNDMLISMEEPYIIKTVDMNDTQLARKVKLDSNVELSCINSDTAYIIMNGRFKSLPVEELLRGKILC